MLIKEAKEIGEGLKGKDEKTREIALFNLRKLTVDLDLLELTDNGFSSKTVAFLYLIKKQVNDVWINFGTDSTYDFPEKIFNEYSKALGNFICFALDNDKIQTTNYLFETIAQYYNNLSEIKKGGEKCGYSKS